MVIFYYPVDLQYVEQKEKKPCELGLETASYNSKFQVCENGEVLWSPYLMSTLRYIYRRSLICTKLSLHYCFGGSLQSQQLPTYTLTGFKVSIRYYLKDMTW